MAATPPPSRQGHQPSSWCQAWDITMAVVPPAPHEAWPQGCAPHPAPHLLPLALLSWQRVQDARLHHLLGT